MKRLPRTALRVLDGSAPATPPADTARDKVLEIGAELEAEYRVGEIRREWRAAYEHRLDACGWGLMLNERAGALNGQLANMLFARRDPARAKAANMCQEVAAIALELRRELLSGDIELGHGA